MAKAITKAQYDYTAKFRRPKVEVPVKKEEVFEKEEDAPKKVDGPKPKKKKAAPKKVEK